MNAPNETVIEFHEVTKTYKLYASERKRFFGLLFGFIKFKKKRANDHISFTITRGESVAILGQNGAGKSTMLKIITGVTFASEGLVDVKGRVGALLELTAGFEPEFTGRENIYLKGNLLGLSKKQIASIEPAIIDFAELNEYIDQPIRTYSSGMKARLGFAINTSIEPDILIIDEALSVGDAKFQEKCRLKIDELTRRDHVTVLLVTHSLNAAKKFCQRGLVLQGGRLICDASIDEAILHYNTSLHLH